MIDGPAKVDGKIVNVLGAKVTNEMWTEIQATRLAEEINRIMMPVLKKAALTDRLAEVVRYTYKGYMADPGSDFDWDCWGNMAAQVLFEYDNLRGEK